MVLIRILVLKSLRGNVRIFAKYVSTQENIFADSLSRDKIKYFKSIAGDRYEKYPTPVLEELWPVSKLWIS